MKRTLKMKVLSFALAFITAVMLFPYGTLTAAADNEWFIDEEAQNESVMNEHNFTKQSEDDTSKHVEEETEFGEEFVYEWNDELKASEESKGGTSQSARSTQITTTGYIPDGVYAIRNVANQNYWMDVQNDSLYAESYIQQSSYSSNPADTFTRPALFKISRIPNTDRYVIRLMTNNRLSIYGTSDKEAATIKVSPRDTDVPVNNTFYITYDTNGYIIKPYQSPSYVLASQSTTHAGESSYPYSKLEFVPRIGSDSKARWQLYQYTGTQKCGILTSRAVSTGDGIPVGQSGSVWMYNWSTVIGANTPYMFVDPSCTSVGDVTWNNDTLDSTVTGLAAGDLKIRLQILYDDSRIPLYTAVTNQVIIPDIAGDTVFVQNSGTGRYIDLEQVNYVPTDIVQQWSFHTGTQAQWIFELGGNGYLKIKSVKTSKYIGVDSTDTTKVKQYSSVTDYTLWKISETSSGDYKLGCKALESNDMALCAPATTSGNGADLTMLAYVNDSDYKDEWKIIAFPIDVSLIALPATYDRSSYFEDILFSLDSVGYEESYDNHTVVTNISSNQSVMLESELLKYMSNSKITLIRTHGGRTGIEVGNGMLNTADLSALGSNYFEYSDLIIYGACGTAMGGENDSGNLVNATVVAGARTAIGFENSVEVTACNQWCEFFFEYYSIYYDDIQKTLIDVCDSTDVKAQQECTFYEYTNKEGNLVSLRNYVVAGDKTIPQ